MELENDSERSKGDPIPNDWCVSPIEERIDFANGKAHEHLVCENGRFVVVNSKFISSNGVVVKYSNTALSLAKRGDILMVMSDVPNGKAVAKCFLVDTDSLYTVNQRVCIIRSKTENSQYLFYKLNRNPYFLAFDDGVKQTNLRKQDILSCSLEFPPTLAEQEAIAIALSDADAWIESLEQLIAKKRMIKQGAMQELLTRKRRLPGFSREWKSKRLQELGDFIKGCGVNRSQANSGDLPCIRYGEIYTRHNDYIRSFHSKISRAVALTATVLKRGDILFAGSGETKEDIGKCVAFVDDFEAYAGGDIVILRTGEEDSVFLGYYLNTAPIAKQKASRGQGDAVVHISASALSSVAGLFPESEEQQAIGRVLLDMDTEIGALQSKLGKARQIKQAMMQELLTGRIRLVKPSKSSERIHEAVNA